MAKIKKTLDVDESLIQAIQQRAVLNGVSWAEAARQLWQYALGVTTVALTDEVEPAVIYDLIKRVERLEQQCGLPAQTEQPKPRIPRTGTHFADIYTDADSEENQRWRKEFREKRIDPTDKPTL